MEETKTCETTSTAAPLVPARAFQRVARHLHGAIRAFREFPPLRGTWVATWPANICGTGIAVSSANEFFVDDDYQSMSVHSVNGAFLHNWNRQVPMPAKGRHCFGLCDIAVAPSGEVVVTDSHNSRVLVFRPDGTFVRQWGSYGSDDGQFYFPRGVAVTKNGDVLVTDMGNHRVQVFRLSDGAFLRQWGVNGSADGQFSTPLGVCITATGEVVIADGANRRVQVFSLDGVFLRKWGSLGSGHGQFQFPVGVAVRGDEVLVTDDGNHRVQVFRLDGTFVRAWGSEGAGDGQFMCPSGLAVTRAGQVLVADRVNDRDGRVQVFE